MSFVVLGALFALSAWGDLSILERSFNVQPMSVVLGIGLCAAGVVCGMVLFLSGLILYLAIRRYSFVLMKDGIGVTATFLGLPIKSEHYDIDEISEFGYGVFSHSSTMCLRFLGGSHFYAMASDVDKSEVEDFLLFLRKQGLEYPSEYKSAPPLRPKTAANTFLR